MVTGAMFLIHYAVFEGGLLCCSFVSVTYDGGADIMRSAYL